MSTYCIKRFTKARRENLTNWDKPHHCKFILIANGFDGSEHAISVVGRHQKRRFLKICKQLNEN